MVRALENGNLDRNLRFSATVADKICARATRVLEEVRQRTLYVISHLFDTRGCFQEATRMIQNDLEFALSRILVL